MGKWDKYRFTLDVLGSQTTVYPIYESLNLQEAKPENEVFLRPTLDATFTFVRGDYEAIEAIAIGVEMLLIIEEITDGPTYTEVYRGVFSRTDCEIDEDSRLVRVKPRPRDAYEKILEALDKEFNLIDLAPEISTVNYTKRPIIQAYLFDSSYVTNFTQGNYWQTPVIAGDVNNITLQTKYYFTLSSDFIYIPGDSSLDPDVSGVYSVTDGLREDGVYQLFYHAPESRWVIKEVSTGTWVYQGISGEGFTNPANFLAPGGTLTSNIDGTSKVQGFRVSVYLRYYTDQETISSVPTFEIPESDIVAENYNYTRVIGLSADSATAYSGHSTTPDVYGKFSGAADNFSGEYFTRLTGTYPAYPLARNEWAYFSLWFEFDSFLIGIEEDYSSPLTCIAYALPDVVAAFLAEIDPTVSHANTVDYSAFFYWSLPENNLVRDQYLTPLFTPKSNILIGDYDQPAKKAPLRFGELLQFLKDFYRVYWYIKDGKFILEHIEFFEKGGDYVTDQIAVDLTLEVETKTGKPWAYRTSKYTYDKAEMPERLEFSWMDGQSPVFEGYPVEMLDSYVDKGNIQTVALSKFSPDIDFILASPGEISKDGFVFIEAERSGSVYNIPLVPLTFEGFNLEVQNGNASLTFGHSEYYPYQLPCTNININNTATTANSVIKTKVQEIAVPVNPAPDSLQLITTYLGNGKTEKRTRKLDTNFIELTLKHDQ